MRYLAEMVHFPTVDKRGIVHVTRQLVTLLTERSGCYRIELSQGSCGSVDAERQLSTQVKGMEVHHLVDRRCSRLTGGGTSVIDEDGLETPGESKRGIVSRSDCGEGQVAPAFNRILVPFVGRSPRREKCVADAAARGETARQTKCLLNPQVELA